MSEPLRNADLESEIARTPDEPSAYLVYADWLAERGDPRGELITIQAALAKKPGDAELQARAEALLDQHGPAWLGDLAEQDGLTCTWRYGFLDTVRIGDDDAAEIDLAGAYASLRTLATAAFVRDLTFGAFSDDDGQPSWQSAIDAMLEHGVPSTLRRLAFDRGEYWDISWTQLGNLEPLYSSLARLEALYIELGHMNLGNIDLVALRDFEVCTGGFTKQNMRSVREARWPQLWRLVLRFGDQPDYGAECDFGDVEPLLSGEGLPNVTHLAIANAGFANEVAAALPSSKILPRLRSLDLSMGLLDDEGAAAIVDNAPKYAHLERLDVSQSYLSEDSIERLRKVVQRVDATEQKQPEGDWRYCQIGE